MLPKLNGVKVPHRKNTAAMPAVKMPTPKSVTIPMNMHIGAPSVPCVKVGDSVVTGQVLGSIETQSGQNQLHFELWKDSTPQNPSDWIR